MGLSERRAFLGQVAVGQHAAVMRAAQEANEAGHEGGNSGQDQRVHFFASTAFCATLPTM